MVALGKIKHLIKQNIRIWANYCIRQFEYKAVGLATDDFSSLGTFIKYVQLLKWGVGLPHRHRMWKNVTEAREGVTHLVRTHYQFT